MLIPPLNLALSLEISSNKRFPSIRLVVISAMPFSYMGNKTLEVIIRDRIKVADGKKFQQLFWDIMMLRYIDFQTPRMQRDLGNDGYSIEGKIFFACYAPESLKYDNADTTKKIKDDYQSFCDSWKSKNVFEKWVFVTKDNLMGVPHQKLVELNALSDGVAKENWGLEHVTIEALCLEERDIIRIFELPDSYFEVAINEERSFGIITEIFEFIFSNKISISNTVIKKSDRYTDLTKKLVLNFSDEELKSAEEMIMRNWERKILVEKYLKDEYERNAARVEALIDTIQSDFRRTKDVSYQDAPIESVRVIEDMARRYLSEDKQSDPDYISGSRAIILYFFELCFLGKRTEEENDGSQKLFEV